VASRGENRPRSQRRAGSYRTDAARSASPLASSFGVDPDRWGTTEPIPTGTANGGNGGARTRSRNRGRATGIRSVKGLSPGRAAAGGLAKIDYANSYGTAALDLRRGAFGCQLAAERDPSLPTPPDAAMLTSKIGGKSGRFRLPRSSHADSPEGDDETFVQDCRCGYHGIDALAGRPGSAGAEIGRHPSPSGVSSTRPPASSQGRSRSRRHCTITAAHLTTTAAISRRGQAKPECTARRELKNCCVEDS
jgi:hypothetical protein